MGVKVRNENYITIQGWMVNELCLKGNELLVYAIIYGFSQEIDNEFNGSLEYLASWTNTTKRGILNVIKSLCDKGLIIKHEIYRGSVKFCSYKTNAIDFMGIENFSIDTNNSVEKSSMDRRKVFNGTVEKSSPNNIDNIEDNIVKKKQVFIPPTLEEIEAYCKARNNNVNAKRFFDYYQAGNWKDQNGKNIQNWKQKLIAVWEKNNTPSTPKRVEPTVTYQYVN